MQDGRKSVCGGIADRIRKNIELGIIADGDKLPSCREYALELGVNPNTVQKAFSMLEEQGYIEVIPQKGAYARKSPLKESGETLIGQAERQIAALRDAGLSRSDLDRAADKIYGVRHNDRN